MIERLVKRALVALAGILNAQFRERIDITAVAEDLYSQGIAMIGSGFVFPSGLDHAVGVYIVKYKPSIEDNKYGRYN
jgi:hypothetical protein